MHLLTPWLLALLPAALAQIRFTEPTSSLSYNMSSITTSSSTDLHFNMSIPASNGWGAIGIGTMMANALIFVLLPDPTNGSTISLRTTSGHIMPKPVTSMTLNVLSGSSEGGIYTASAVCRACQTWSDGSFDASSTNQQFLYAVGPGTDGVSGSGQSAMIMQHAYHGNFEVDMTKAAAAAAGVSGSGAPSSSGGSSPAAAGGNSGVGASVQTIPPPSNLIMAHASLFGVVFGILLPLGVIFLRLPALGWMPHAGVQVLASILAVAGLGIAIHMSLVSTTYNSFRNYHQIVGLLTISTLLANVFLGVAHHTAFRKLERRSVVTYLHLWAGRVVMLLGVINLILGFNLTGLTSAAIGVGVVGLLIYFTAFGVAAFMKTRGRKTTSVGSMASGGQEPEMTNVVGKPTSSAA